MKVNIVKEGMKYGVICGLVAMIILYVSWGMGLQTFVSVQFITTFIPFMIGILLIGGFRVRKQNGGYLSFAEGIKFAFLSYVIAEVIMGVGHYVLYNLIDKNLTITSFKAGLERTRAMMQSVGAPPEQINKAIADAEAKSPDKTGAGTIFVGIGLGLIWDFIKALLITLVIKKEEKFDN
jgi:hypothetical protein